MLNNLVKITINEANLRNDHFYLGANIEFFPADTIGGKNKTQVAPQPIRITLPFGEEVETDIARDKKIFRKRAWVRRLYEYRNAKPGDQLVLSWVAPYRLNIDIEKGKVMKDFSKGQTIQVPIDKQPHLDRKVFYIPAALADFFPSDALGARGKEDTELYPSEGKPVEFDYGVIKSFCDIATRKSGVMRPRDNKGMRIFLETNQAALGDVVCLTRTGERNYKVSFIKR